MYTLHSVISTSLMSFLLLYPETLAIGCSQFTFHSLLSWFFPMYHGFRHYIQPSSSEIDSVNVHSTLRNINLLNVIPSLISRKLSDRKFSVYILLLVVMFPSHVGFRHSNRPLKDSNHTLAHITLTSSCLLLVAYRLIFKLIFRLRACAF